MARCAACIEAPRTVRGSRSCQVAPTDHALSSAGEQGLALRMDGEVRTLLEKLGVKFTPQLWTEYISACQALPADAPQVLRSLDMSSSWPSLVTALAA